jgi:hypothetical protein
MIQRAFITEWRAKAPWALDEQVEQDLILSRALVELYSDSVLHWDQAEAAEYVLTKLAPILPGEAWRGSGEEAHR